MDPTTLTIGGLAALAAFNGMHWWCARRDLRDLTQLGEERTRKANRELFTALTALRHHCFITDERGHRVRYVNASQEARAKAEGV
jgi:hypothetical protein